MKINLWDAAFAHLPYSVPGRVSRNIEWVRGQLSWPGVTVVTDDYLSEGRILDLLESPVTIGWLLEGRAYGERHYAAVPRIIRQLDLLFTHDAQILAAYPDKARFVPYGGCWIADRQWGMHPKPRDVSHIYSAKAFMEGHRLRHEIAARFPAITTFGHGTPRPLADKADGLRDFLFSIVVENDRAPNYFTEKLIDCFALGTVPIYWGCPNIGDFFDIGGIIQFAGLDDLPGILGDLDYTRHVAAATRNMQTARRYVLPEKRIYEHVRHMEGAR